MIKKIPFFIQSIVYLIVGIILFTKPSTSLLTISYILAGLLIVVGVLNIINSLSKNNVSTSFAFAGGVLCIIIGAFLVYKPKTISQILLVILSFGIILSGVFKLQNALEMFKSGRRNWWVFLIIAVVILGYGVMTLFNPFKTALTLVKYLGIGFIVSGVADFISTIIVSSKVKKLKK